MAWIVFEGLDGAGKSSLINSLHTKLQQQGCEVVLTREPGGTILGEELREVLLRRDGEMPTARTELLIYEAIRAQHVEQVIQPALADKKWVLCDRFTASTLAFQSAGRGLPTTEIEWLNEFASLSLRPEQQVLLDLPIEVSQARRQGRGEEDRFEVEAASFHQRVRESYLQQAQAQPAAWLVLDAENSVEELTAKVWHSWQQKAWVTQ